MAAWICYNLAYMEPTISPQHGSPEIAPLPAHLPESQPVHLEAAISSERPAQQEIRRDNPLADGVHAIPVPPVPVIPVSIDPVIPPIPKQRVIDDNPLLAADNDVMEKEWVKKAKDVVSQTKHDPYEQEKAVSRLQADYLSKRYGKVVKLSDGE